MDVSSRSLFCGAALVSELLTQEQLDDVVRAAGAKTPGPPLPVDQLEDDQIAQTAIELGYLNLWQIEQLKAGRTKFTLGPYHIIDSIGQGGMGHVFKGEHAMLGRIEAVKVLPKSKTTPESIASFQREIRAQAQLDHPNLVRLSYAGQEGATYFFVTEYVPGTDLRRLVRRNGRLTMQEAATIISQTANGLQHAHERGLVHRDIKPGNLLVTPEGRTKVTDLGLAGFLNEEESDSPDPRAGKIVGTADYLAPETIRTPNDVRPTGDIYALGCTLYYAVTGKVPFPGGTTADKLRRHLEETPYNPLRFNPDLDEDFLEIMADMMEKDPAKRIQTAKELVRRLAPWTQDHVSTPIADEHTPPPAGRRAPAAIPVPAQPAAEPHFLDQGGVAVDPDLDSPSQASQGTVPVFASKQETTRIESDDEPTTLIERLAAEPLVPVLLIAGVGITLIVLFLVLLR